MAIPFLDLGQPLLDARFPLSLAEPFTTAMAKSAGIQSAELSRLVRSDHLRRMVEGVYVTIQTRDSVSLRAQALSLVVPGDAVVTDRTAGWLHGADLILAPNDHLQVPPVSVFVRRRGARLRTDLTRSGQRMMPDRDVTEIGGVAVTTPLRTACDLGRLLHRDQAFAALDTMLRLRLFSKEDLLMASAGYKGYRHVRQLRALAPFSDALSESPGESILRLRWLDCPGLPPPVPQVRVEGPGGGYYFLDLGIEEIRFGVEYDGADFHGPDREQHDRQRRSWITGRHEWTLRIVRKHNVFGPRQDIEDLLWEGVAEARSRLPGRRTFI